MKIAQRWEAVSVWLNADLKARRIDAILLVGGIVCVTYYYWASGWQGALVGGLMYIMMVMISVWLI
jgi:glucose-6-phosphate-specific signal transduction histidine kinase